jgi:Uma2 family endonuclease
LTPPSTVNSQQSTVNSQQAPTVQPESILVINQKNLSSEPLWKKSSTVTQAASVPLVIEVVSTNWQDDYAHKLVDYEILGIPEYWIIDYLGLGSGMCSKF